MPNRAPFDIEAYLGGFIDRVEEVWKVTRDHKEYLGVRAWWVDTFESMITHTRGLTPVKLLHNFRPNESQDIYEYRLANYEPITQDGIEKAIDRLTRTFNKSNFKLNISNRILEYIDDKCFTLLNSDQGSKDCQTFEQLMLSTVLRADIEDPNGVLAWFPVNVDPNLPPSENPPTEKIEVEPLLVWSTQIVDFNKDVFSFQAEGQWCFMNGNDKICKPYYYVMTQEFIYRVIPTGIDKDGKIVYTWEVYYDLGDSFDTCPAVLLKGEQSATRDNDIYYQSFFNSYVAAGNQAIRGFSDWQAVMVQSNFPVKAIKGQKCYTCDGTKRVKTDNKDDSGKVIWKKCDTCNGTGQTAALSPNSTYIKKPPGNTENENFALSPAVEFYSPDIGILDKSKEAWEDLLDRAERSINVKFIEEAQSGVSKDKDLEQLMDMLNKISKNIFRIVVLSLNIIESYREPFSQNRDGSGVVEPTDFRIKSQKELTEELTILIEKKAPQSFVFNTAKNLAKELYNGDPVSQKIVDIQGLWDALFGKDIDVISKLKAMGGATDSEIIKHANAFTILQGIANDMREEQFLNTDIDKIIEEANKRLQDFIPQELKLVDEEGLSDTEAEAQAKLRGTVGGIQGIIQINSAVASGLMSEAAAESILSEVYGFLPELSAKIIDVGKSGGDVSKIPQVGKIPEIE